jgi:hypothetical protein
MSNNKETLNSISHNLKNFNKCEHQFISNTSELSYEEKLVDYMSSLRRSPEAYQSSEDIKERILAKLAKSKKENFERKKKIILGEQLDKQIIENTYKELYREIDIKSRPEYDEYKKKIDKCNSFLRSAAGCFCILAVGFLFNALDARGYYYRNIDNLINDKKSFQKIFPNFKIFVLLTVPLFVASCYFYKKRRTYLSEFESILKEKYVGEINLDDAINKINIYF